LTLTSRERRQSADEIASDVQVSQCECVRRVADFWSRSLQNWQSELLAVASMAILSVYLRQRGSPKSKPVGTPHTSTGVEG
jgi:hypothetical protein